MENCRWREGREEALATSLGGRKPENREIHKRPVQNRQCPLAMAERWGEVTFQSHEGKTYIFAGRFPSLRSRWNEGCIFAFGIFGRASTAQSSPFHPSIGYRLLFTLFIILAAGEAVQFFLIDFDFARFQHLITQIR